MTLKTTTWDASEHLDSAQMIKEYIQAAIEENDPALLRLALADVAKAKGMSTIAEQAQLNRQNLYKSLSAKGNPSFDTINKVMHALGLKLQVSEL
jgi:probable addiction module antidote protein